MRAIADALCTDYEVERDQAERDVEAFVRALAAAGVVTIREEPA